MLELRKRYLELKVKAKQMMLEGNMSMYLKLMTEVEQMNLILVRVNKQLKLVRQVKAPRRNSSGGFR